MRPLNAIEAIQPAWTHTRKLLLTPRRWKTFFKIATVAFFAQMGGFNANSHFNTNNSSHAHLPHVLQVAALATTILIAFVVFLIAICFFYLGSRLQFVLFEVVLRCDTKVAPIWNRYGAATWRWIGLKLLYFLLAILALSPFIVPVFLQFFRTLKTQPQHPHDPLAFLGAIAGFIAAIFFISIVISLGYTALRDFGLPSMALEGTSLTATVGRVWGLFRTDPLNVVGYLLLYLLLSFVGVLVAYILLAIVWLLSLIPFAAIGGIFWAVLRHAGNGAHIVMYASLGILGLLYVVLIICSLIMAIGYLLVFMQAYALYFLGGRYPMVGQYLEPLLPVAPTYPYGYAAPPAYPPAPVYPPPPPTPEPEPPLNNPPSAIETTE